MKILYSLESYLSQCWYFLLIVHSLDIFQLGNGYMLSSIHSSSHCLLNHQSFSHTSQARNNIRYDTRSNEFNMKPFAHMSLINDNNHNNAHNSLIRKLHPTNSLLQTMRILTFIKTNCTAQFVLSVQVMKKNPVPYISIPVSAALIGYITNWLGELNIRKIFIVDLYMPDLFRCLLVYL